MSVFCVKGLEPLTGFPSSGSKIFQRWLEGRKIRFSANMLTIPVIGSNFQSFYIKRLFV